MNIETVDLCYENWKSTCARLQDAQNELNEARGFEIQARVQLQAALNRLDAIAAVEPASLPKSPSESEIESPVKSAASEKPGRRAHLTPPMRLGEYVLQHLEGKDWTRVADVVSAVLPLAKRDGHRTTTADGLRVTIRTLHKKGQLLKEHRKPLDNNGQKIVEVRLP